VGRLRRINQATTKNKPSTMARLAMTLTKAPKVRGPEDDRSPAASPGRAGSINGFSVAAAGSAAGVGCWKPAWRTPESNWAAVGRDVSVGLADVGKSAAAVRESAKAKRASSAATQARVCFDLHIRVLPWNLCGFGNDQLGDANTKIIVV